MMTLYELTKNQVNIINKIETMQGELTQEDERFLEINKDELKEKTLAYIEVIKDKEFFISKIDDEIKRLNSIKKTQLSTIERLKNNLSTAVRVFGDYTAGTFSLSFRKSYSLKINEDAKIPAPFLIEKITTQADKNKLKEAIKNGAEIDGVYIKENNNLKIK